MYFSRPEDDVILRVLEGSDMIEQSKAAGFKEGPHVTSAEWTLRVRLVQRDVYKFHANKVGREHWGNEW